MNINQRLKESPCGSARGAPFGRASWGLTEYRTRPTMMYLQRVKFIDGDYDLGGAYWGGYPSEPLFCAWAEGVDARVFVRAKTRDEAKELVKESFINAKFFR